MRRLTWHVPPEVALLPTDPSNEGPSCNRSDLTDVLAALTWRFFRCAFVVRAAGRHRPRARHARPGAPAGRTSPAAARTTSRHPRRAVLCGACGHVTWEGVHGQLRAAQVLARVGGPAAVAPLALDVALAQIIRQLGGTPRGGNVPGLLAEVATLYGHPGFSSMSVPTEIIRQFIGDVGGDAAACSTFEAAMQEWARVA